MKTLFLWFLMVPIRVVAPLLSPGIIYALGKAGGRVYFHLSRDAAGRIATRFKELVQDGESYDYRRVALRSCQNFITSELETLLYERMRPDNIHRYISIEGESRLDEALAAGRGVILLHAHFGNAHMLMPALGHRGYTVNQVGLQPSDTINRIEGITLHRPDNITRNWFRFKDRYEKSLPANFIFLGQSLYPAIESLKKKEILAISIDGVEGEMVSVPFLRKKASFMTGPIRLAKITGAMIVPAFTVRSGDGTIRLVIEEPIREWASIEEGVRLFSSVLEEYVKKYPCHYARLLAFDVPPFGSLT